MEEEKGGVRIRFKNEKGRELDDNYDGRSNGLGGERVRKREKSLRNSL